jgi:hypothetical protein
LATRVWQGVRKEGERLGAGGVGWGGWEWVKNFADIFLSPAIVPSQVLSPTCLVLSLVLSPTCIVLSLVLSPTCIVLSPVLSSTCLVLSLVLSPYVIGPEPHML